MVHDSSKHPDANDTDLDASTERLLGEDADGSFHLQRSKSWRSYLKRPIYFHCALFVLYTSAYVILLLATIHYPSSPLCKNVQEAHFPLPHRDGLIWEDRKFPTKIVDNPLTGHPRPELEKAWHDLLMNDNIRVPKDYLDERNLTSVYTLDGSEGIASLGVFHSLHCLKKVKQMTFKEHYHKTKSAEAMAREIKHVDHCVEYIREALMCQPDLGMVTFRWINNTAQHEDKSGFWPTNFDVDTHRCANWDALNNWAGQRMFNLFEVDKLQRPMPEV